MAIDLNAVTAGLSELDRQVRDLRRSLEAARRQREELAAAPLPRADVLALLQGEVDYWASQAPTLLDKTFSTLASRPGKLAGDWQGRMPLLPASTPELAHVLPALLGTELKAGLATAINARAEDPAAGLPWSERAASLAALDLEIETAESDLATLRGQVMASGLRWPGEGLY